MFIFKTNARLHNKFEELFFIKVWHRRFKLQNYSSPTKAITSPFIVASGDVTIEASIENNPYLSTSSSFNNEFSCLMESFTFVSIVILVWNKIRSVVPFCHKSSIVVNCLTKLFVRIMLMTLLGLEPANPVTCSKRSTTVLSTYLLVVELKSG